MAIQFWKDMSILYGWQQLAGNAKDITIATEVTPLDVTPLSTTGSVSLIGGLKTSTVTIGEFMQDTVAFGPEMRLSVMLGTKVVKSICTASADGSPAYLLEGIPLQYTPWSGTVGDVAMGSISGSATGPVVRGLLLHPSSTGRTSSSSGVARQLGAISATQSIYAAIHVTLATGTLPTLVVKVQSDDNEAFTTPTDRITFTTATTVTSQFTSAAGAITDTWWRVTYTIGGTSTPTFAFAVTAGIL